MSAELLRRAAAKMRESAGETTPSPWKQGPFSCEVRGNGGRNFVTSTYGGILGSEEANAAHIASWHPDVALAVADLLDAYSLLFCDCCDEGEGQQPPHLEHLVAVARAYLGEA